ncbi:hypothetical protein [Paenibacillus harenae]|uniref:Copper amine oxidase-like N-terminal domain-containing protein n=1 Tax=Paenibacillus harenae TaxID=306543 RepID=A0ABT9TTQ4_PAEHA|nr:hypothetical protein [Paenibacillus harenae]MDQ0110732.1 hypothetical protein [Paenibacillus harenae]
MKMMVNHVKVKWAAKLMIAASIALVPVAAGPAVGSVYAAEQNSDGYASSELKEMHAKVDAYVFVDHAEELAEKGIQVTNTGPVGDFIEIGIQDFTEEKAAYLNAAFDSELIKVVEGVQAVTLNNTLQMATDNEMSTTSVDAPAADSSEMAVSTAADTGTSAAEANVQNAASGSMTGWIVVIAAAALAAFAFASRKLKLSKK